MTRPAWRAQHDIPSMTCMSHALCTQCLRVGLKQDAAQIAVSSSENPELLAGLRGAGTLFGIVTEVTFQLFNGTSDVYAGMLRFAEDDNYTTYR